MNKKWKRKRNELVGSLVIKALKAKWKKRK